MFKTKPLVTIGIPTYNRPKNLYRTLENITSQTYSNLEIIISDNASTNQAVSKVLSKWVKKDHRIRSITQYKNFGPLKNFTNVLMEASGEFFMWAADDDLRESDYISACMQKFEEYPHFAAVTTEVQFICNGKKMPVFPQGKAFYSCDEKMSGLSTAIHALNSNYDNLIYSLFRKSALVHEDKCVWLDVAEGAGNEIPAILHAAMKGGFLVIPEYKFFKRSTTSSYLQARWEVLGGAIPDSSKINSLKSAISTYKYHIYALREIKSAIKLLPLTKFEKLFLFSKAVRNLNLHFYWMLMRKKPSNMLFDQFEF